MSALLNLYDTVASEVANLPPFDEMLFYAGAPDAEIVVVSEAPTLPNSPDDHTLYHAVTEEMADQPLEEVAAYLRSYPFQDTGRNVLYREYVDKILAFCARPTAEIGFTNLCKRPLTEFEEGTTLDTVWNDSAYSQADMVRAQLRAVGPRVVVCNKKNVSRLVSRAFLGSDGYDGSGWPASTWDRVPSEELTLVYSTIAHMQMRLLSRKRLSDEIKQLYSQE